MSALDLAALRTLARESRDVSIDQSTPALATAVEQLCEALEKERSEVERLTRDRASLMGISERTMIESNEAHVTIERMKPVVDAAAKWKVALPEELRRVVVAYLGAASSHPTSDIDATCTACGEESDTLLTTGAAGSASLCVGCYHTAAEEALRAHATDRAAWEAERATLMKDRDAARADVDRAIAERSQILAERIVVDRKAERYYVHWQGALMSSEANAATVRALTEERNALDVRVEQLEAALADAKTTIERLTREALENDLVGAETMLSFVKGMPEEAEAKAYVAELRAKLGGSS